MTANAVHPEAAATAPHPASVPAPWQAWLRVLRPRQWLKNSFILAPLLFSARLLEAGPLLNGVATFVSFCLLASGVYLLNDVLDRVADQSHPIKRSRPIASGLIAPRTALAAALVLFVGGLAGSALVSALVAAYGLLYVALNILYSVALKRVVILDVFTIAAFFVIRLLTGSAAAGVVPSIWLLLCGGLLALYLAFAKRRHELELLQGSSAAHREVLSQYTTAFLDQLSVVLLAITVIAYVMYTLESDTAKQVGANTLAYSTVFVLYGVIRYLYLVHRRSGGDPAESLLTDRALLITGFLWVVYCGLVIYRPL